MPVLVPAVNTVSTQPPSVSPTPSPRGALRGRVVAAVLLWENLGLDVVVEVVVALSSFSTPPAPGPAHLISPGVQVGALRQVLPQVPWSAQQPSTVIWLPDCK